MVAGGVATVSIINFFLIQWLRRVAENGACMALFVLDAFDSLCGKRSLIHRRTGYCQFHAVWLSDSTRCWPRVHIAEHGTPLRVLSRFGI